MSVSWIDTSLIAAAQHAAQTTARRRSHHNFHRQLDEACQRLLVAIEPDSYIAPHCHLSAGKEETILCLRGRIGVLFFDLRGDIAEARVLAPAGSNVGVHVPLGIFHTLVALAPESVFFETKAGPYQPLVEQEWAPWAPREGGAEVTAYQQRLQEYFSAA